MNWEQLPNGKWRPARKPVAPGKIDPDDPNYGARLRAEMKKTWVFCDVCQDKYNLGEPCVHHLSDSPSDRKKYDLYKKAQKEKAMVEEATKQVKL